MNRPRLALLVAAVALPIVVLSAMVTQGERDLRSAMVFSIPIRGVDPRDPLRGHYLTFDYDWDWTHSEPNGGQGPLCLTKPRDPAKGPQASFATDGCLARIDGVFLPARPPPSFWPQNIRPRLYIPEEYAPRLDHLLRVRSAVVTIDLAVTADHRALIHGWRVDGKEPRDYFR